MKTYIIPLHLAIIALATSSVSLPLQGQEPSQEPAKTKQAIPKSRPLPYRGVIGTIDIEKKTFTLKNKSNKEMRVFQVDQETRFEFGTTRKALKDLQPNMQITGSCIKTGDRHYLAKLVRWKPSPEKDENASKTSNLDSSQAISSPK